MQTHLTQRERECIELHYFRGLCYRAIGKLTRTNASSACRAAARGVRKLREAAQADGLVVQ